jgi:hypothetical protein
LSLKPARRLGLVAVAVALWASGASAAGVYWNNPAGGLWSDPANWAPSVVPGSTDDVYITLDGQYSVTIDSTATSVHSLTLGGEVEIQTLLANDKTIDLGTGAVIEAHGAVHWTSCGVTSTGTIDNHGTVLLESTTLSAAVVNHGVFTRDPVSTFDGPVDNYGKLVMEGVTVASTALVNHPGSTLRIEGTPRVPAEFDFTGSYVNEGILDLACALGFGNVTVRATDVNGVLVNAAGGTVHAYPAGSRIVDARLENHGVIDVQHPLTLQRANAAHENYGTIELTAGNLTVSGAGVSFLNRGTLAIGAARTFTQATGTFTNDTIGVIRGAGTCSVAAATNVERGHIAPGDPAGTLTFPGNVTLAPSGAVDLVLRSATPADQGSLHVGSFMVLEGVLTVAVAGGFTPAPGQRFDVIAWGDHVNVFSRIDGLDLPGGLALRPEYSTSGLTLECFTGHVAGAPVEIPTHGGTLRFGRIPAPNPTAAAASFSIVMPRAGAITVGILDVTGRVVATLHRGVLPAGEHAFVWRGATDAGGTAPTGLYFAAAAGAGGTARRRIALAR